MADRAWCDDHGMQDVVESEINDSGDRYATVETYFIQHLACGDTRSQVMTRHPSPLGRGDGDL
jgi:hypothetical protein